MPSKERNLEVDITGQADIVGQDGIAPQDVEAPLKPVATLTYSTGTYHVKAKLNLDEAVGEGTLPERRGEAEPLQDADLDELRRALASLPHLVGTDLAGASAPPPLAPVPLLPQADPVAPPARRRPRAFRIAIGFANIVLLILCISLSAKLGYWDFLRRAEAPWMGRLGMERLAAVPRRLADRLRPAVTELTSAADGFLHRIGGAAATKEAATAPPVPSPSVPLPSPVPPPTPIDAASQAQPAASAELPAAGTVAPSAVQSEKATASPPAPMPPTDAAAKAAVAALLPPAAAPAVPVGSVAAPAPELQAPEASPMPDSSAPGPLVPPPAAVAVAVPIPVADAAPPAAPHAEAVAEAPPAVTPATDTPAAPEPAPPAAAKTADGAAAAAAPPVASDRDDEGADKGAAAPAETAAPAGPLFLVQFGAYRTAASAARNCNPFAALAPVGVAKGEHGSKWYFCRTAAPLGHDAASALIGRAKAQLGSDAFLVPDPAGAAQ